MADDLTRSTATDTDYVEPQITSNDPNERKLARRLRIDRRWEAIRRQGTSEMLLEDDIPKPIQIQVQKSAELLERYIYEGEEYVSNVRVANDGREVDRRDAEGINREKVIEQLEIEAAESEKAFEEIAEKWTVIQNYNDPLHINEDIMEQKEKCDLVIKQKDGIIAMMKEEINKADKKFDADQEKQIQDIDTLAHRIEKQITFMRSAYQKEFELIEDVILAERQILIENNHKKWEELYKKRDEQEVDNSDNKFELLKEFYLSMKDKRTAFQEKYRKTKITLENDIDTLQKELERIKALALLNSEKLDYNYQILKKREDENIIIKSQQKRRINKLQDIINSLRKKISDYETSTNNEIKKIRERIKKLHRNILQVEAKADLFAKINDEKFHQVWDMNRKSCESVLKQIMDTDKILHEQQLGIVWDPPSYRITKISQKEPGIPHVNDSSSSIVSNKGKKNEETQIEMVRTSITTQLRDKNPMYKRLVTHILKHVSDKSGFLTETKLRSILRPYEDEQKTLVRLDNVFEVNVHSNAKPHKTRGFGNLPEHVLLNIFGYFDEKELRNNIIPVCQQWRMAGENPALWKCLTFSGVKVETSVICDKIWQYKNVDKIHLRKVPGLTLILRQISRCSENLQYLTLRYCSAITEDSLRHIISKCKTLKGLDLKGTPFRSLIFYEELSCVRSLTRLNLSENCLLTRSNILTAAVNCRNLEAFHLSTFEPRNKILLEDSDCYFVLTSMIHDLKELSLDCATLNSYAIAFVLCCKNLRYLCLNYAYNFEGVHFQNIWKTLTHLTSLKVRFGHQITDLNVKHLFEEGKDVLGNLQVLDFTGCLKISDGGLNAVANCCPKLKTLNVRSCKNIRNLFLITKKCQHLEMFNIAFCENLDTDLLLVPAALKVLFISNSAALRCFAELVKETSCETIIQSIKVDRKEDIDALVNFFIPYSYCAKCAAILELAPQMSVVISRYTPSQLSTLSTVYSKTEIENVECSDLEDAFNAVQQPIELIEDIVMELVVSESSSEEDQPGADAGSLICGEATVQSNYTAFKEKKGTGKKTYITEDKMLCQYNHPLVISSIYVLKALREFVTSYYAEKEGLPTTRERLEKKRLTNSRMLHENDIKHYWEQFTKIYNEDRVRVWDGLLAGLKKYHEILRDRKVLCEEVIALRQQNHDFKRLLSNYIHDGDLMNPPCAIEQKKCLSTTAPSYINTKK